VVTTRGIIAILALRLRVMKFGRLAALAADAAATGSDMVLIAPAGAANHE
jgi:hypothetical protein